MIIPAYNTIYSRVNTSGAAGPFEYTAIDNTYSMEFDGTNYVESSYTGNVTTLSLWFKPDTTITTSTSVQCLTGFEDGGNFAGIYLGSYTGSISNELITIKTTASSNASYYSQLGGTISDTWHHLVIVGTGTQYDIYLDNNNVFSGNLGGDVALINASRLDIGARILSSSISAPFIGLIDEVALWNTALSEGTIEAIYNTTNDNPGKVANLLETPEGAPVAWYRFE